MQLPSMAEVCFVPRTRWPLVGLVALLLGCSEAGVERPRPEPGSEPAGMLSVAVVHYPLRYLAERIGGDLVSVTFPAPAAVDPAFWSPDPETVARYQTADLVLLGGAGYAHWVQRASLRQAALVDTSAGFRDRFIPLDDAPTHTHGPEGAHSHRGFASTFWLDPMLAIEQARAVQDAFVAARPEHEKSFRAGFESLESDLLDLDARFDEVAAEVGDAPLLFSHPVYPYLIRRYGLNARSLHWEPDEMPDERLWAELEELLAEHPARWMLWEATPLEETARRLETLGVGSLVFSLCANAPEAGDFLDAMRANAAALQAASAPRPPLE